MVHRGWGSVQDEEGNTRAGALKGPILASFVCWDRMSSGATVEFLNSYTKSGDTSTLVYTEAKPSPPLHRHAFTRLPLLMS